MPAARLRDLLERVGILIAVDALEDQRRARAPFGEGPEERLGETERVLAPHDGVEVEEEQEQEPLGQPERAPAGRGGGRDAHRRAHVRDRDGRHGGERLRDERASGPHLVDVLERAAPALRERRHLPPPPADGVAAREEVRSDLRGEGRQDVRVDADQVDGEAVAGDPDVGERMALAAVGRRDPDRDDRDPLRRRARPIACRATSPTPSSERRYPATLTPSGPGGAAGGGRGAPRAVDRQQRLVDGDLGASRRRAPSRCSRRRPPPSGDRDRRRRRSRRCSCRAAM